MMPEPLAIYSAVNTTWGLSKEIYGFVNAIIQAEKQAKAISLRLQFTTIQIKFFVDFFQTNETSLEEDLASTTKKATEVINISLKETAKKLQKYNPKSWKRGSWPLIGPSIDEAEKSLAEWVKRMTDTFILLPNSVKEKAASSLVRLPSERAEDPHATLRDCINMVLKQKNTTDEGLLNSLGSDLPDEPNNRIFYWRDRIHVPEWVQNDDEDYKLFKIEVARLAEVLKLARSNLIHVPQASLWFEDTLPGQNAETFGIAYKIPDILNLWPSEEYKEKTPTLKDVVRNPPEHSLNRRVDLATELVRAIAFVHGLGWVHKTIRSDNVLLIFGQSAERPPTGLGHVNLKGFRISRRVATDARSTNIEQENALQWYNQIYVHPKRQRNNLVVESREFEEAQKKTSSNAKSSLSPTNIDQTNPSPNPAEYIAAPWDNLPTYEFYKYKHDIYSLGVVLLELGLWRDLTPKKSALRVAPSSSSSLASTEITERVQAQTHLTERIMNLEKSTPEARMAGLIEIASDHLGTVMGQRYLNIVQGCLSVDTTKWNIQRVLEEITSIQL